MIRKLFLLITLSLCFSAISKAEDNTSDLVKTLTVRVKDFWQLPPAIELNSGQIIEIKFDYLDLNSHYFYYKIAHCDADWNPSQISESEYLDGFNNRPVENRKTSFNTYENYTNYRFEIPNDFLKIKLSGNYLISIYDNDNPDKIITTARFFVYEKLVNIGATINTITDLDYNSHHQQLDVQLDTRNNPIRSPQLEMKLIVNQNSRTDNQVMLNMPSITQGSNLIFNHVRDLIFEAGNEFRRFEMVSYRFNGLNVEQIRHINPYYNVFLFTDKIKKNGSYIYDQDQDGRFFIRNSEAQDFDNESDYFVTHFSLASNTPLEGGKIYLLGEFNHFSIDPKWEMKYDSFRQLYSLDAQLKQGAYNYQYIFLPDGKSKGTTALTEGNFYETENEYTLRLYHKPLGSRYDRLVGYQLIKSGK